MNEQEYKNKIEELQLEISKLKQKQTNQILKNKYGLNWIDIPEAFDYDFENKIPILEEIKNKEIKSDDNKPTHLIIEGDNYHALTCLNYTHAGKIDCIYIDPPYNTGKEFAYKDARFIKEFPDGKIISKESPIRHSAWLSFMSKRLQLAKKLLSDNGVIFISIDDYEQANLTLLCQEIFNNEIELMVWRKSGIGRDGKMKNTTTFRIDHEYILVGYKNNKKLNKSILRPNFENEYGNYDNDPRGNYKAGSISRTESASNPTHKNYYTVTSPSGKKITRQFDISQEEFESLNADNRIYWGKKNDAVPSLKIFVNEEREVTTSSIIDDKLCTTTNGSKELEDILALDNVGAEIRPKPSELIKRLVQIGSNKNSIILDFFAGSGTTMNAVMNLNKADKGTRQCILVQIPEHTYELKDNIEVPKKNSQIVFNAGYRNISDITYERNRRIINGYKNLKGEIIKGIGNSIKYYKTSFIGKNNSQNATDDDRIALAQKAGCLISLSENTLDEVKSNNYYQFYTDNKKITAIYFNLNYSKLSNFVEEIMDFNTQTTVYIFTWGTPEIFENEFEDMTNITIKSIPQPILEIYKSINGDA